MRQETTGCSGVSWTIFKQSAPHSRQITTTTSHHSIFTGQMLFLMPNQQCQSTEGTSTKSNHKHTHSRLMALFPGLPRWAGTRKVKPILILLKQETVSGRSISWAICKSEPCSGQITTAPHHSSFFTGWMPFLPPNQKRQSTEGTKAIINKQKTC